MYLGDVCTLESNNSPGTCKLFTACPKAQEDLQKNKRFPQTCGFKGTQPIVCCPTDSAQSEQPEPQKPERQPGEISKKSKCLFIT